jgi:secreted Zn-dependent insulinase-like peptidase
MRAGYVVHIGRTTFGTQLYAIQALIQSNKQDPVYLDSKIEEFLSEFRQTLATMVDADFADNVNAVIEELIEKPKNLGEESRQLWASIESGRYAFDLREVTIWPLQILWDHHNNRSIDKDCACRRLLYISSQRTAEWMRQEVSRELLLEFFDTYISSASETRKKLSVQVFGCKQTIPTEPLQAEHTHLIDDVTTFKRQSALLPYPAPDPCFYKLYDYVASDSA